MMNQHDETEYWLKAIKALGFRNGSDLVKALGCSEELEHYYNRPPGDDPEMTDDLKQFLIKLAGPYGRALLAAFKAAGLKVKI